MNPKTVGSNPAKNPMLFFFTISKSNENKTFNYLKPKRSCSSSSMMIEHLGIYKCKSIQGSILNNIKVLEPLEVYFFKRVGYTYRKINRLLKHRKIYTNTNLFNFLFIKYKYNNRITMLSTYGGVILRNFRSNGVVNNYPLFGNIIRSSQFNSSRFLIYLNFFNVQNNFLYGQNSDNWGSYIDSCNCGPLNNTYFYFNFRSALGVFKHYKNLRNVKKNRYKILKTKNRNLQNLK